MRQIITAKDKHHVRTIVDLIYEHADDLIYLLDEEHHNPSFWENVDVRKLETTLEILGNIVNFEQRQAA